MVTGLQVGGHAFGLLQRAQAALESGGSGADELAALLQYCCVSAPVRGHFQLHLQRSAKLQGQALRRCPACVIKVFSCCVGFYVEYGPAQGYHMCFLYRKLHQAFADS